MIYVIGAGPAGRMASLRLAGAGKEVTLLERKAIGGTCIHDGCMLVCGLNDVARSINTLSFLKKSGVIDGDETFNNNSTLHAAHCKVFWLL